MDDHVKMSCGKLSTIYQLVSWQSKVQPGCCGWDLQVEPQSPSCKVERFVTQNYTPGARVVLDCKHVSCMLRYTYVCILIFKEREIERDGSPIVAMIVSGPFIVGHKKIIYSRMPSDSRIRISLLHTWFRKNTVKKLIV